LLVVLLVMWPGTLRADDPHVGSPPLRSSRWAWKLPWRGRSGA